ncbi:hypothetical protein [Pedobacter sp. GR22-10]|jgi:hypothetical protein|uniref:hypothetical protein n=1 Tax=Pedobacter sp. GR22-10 TaxID=2994472 RepID=UPI0022460E6A|nr:hypothetical protein [Pedobacter sp. GR22-10]MCX2431365.1 hypothetical protein [Pedobacter sp. GR22-10]
MQDPWHSNYYEDKPQSEKPAKYWFSYRLNKFLEPIAIKQADGIISVSKAYIETLCKRYPGLKTVPQAVITFGAYAKDFERVQKNWNKFELPFEKKDGCTHLVYVGRGGSDMKDALILLFNGFRKGLNDQYELFSKLRFHFIGTSYAPAGKGIQTIMPIAIKMGISAYVEEQTDRIPYYQGIFTLLNADGLIVIGSNDVQYTASKVYPYILAEKPLLTLFHSESSAAKIIKECEAGEVFTLNDKGLVIEEISHELYLILSGKKKSTTNWSAFEQYSTKNLTEKQCELFNSVLDAGNLPNN